ncbi:YidC/Oxa1 family membrane protein insertase, partial [Candidatus Parcubacteria bacterium]|nr:YidC/Oxa1 family membrane protein insertase [Candidatus Parcubacteria bacterium]
PAPPPAGGGEPSFQRAIQVQTVYVFPIIIAVLSLQFPAALSLYWVVLNVVGILQQELIRSKSDT